MVQIINQSKDSQSPENKRHRIGYWWSEKKAQKFNPIELTVLFAERNCEFVKLDLEKPIEDQGPFSLIVHKISDILVKADQGDIGAKKIINAFESYSRKNPQTIILDPLDATRSLLDRYKQYGLIEQSVLAKEGVLFTPPFIHLTSTNIDVNRGRIRRSKLTYPIVCKPILAQGSQVAHQMCIIFNEAGLKDVKPPCVAQSFVNHNAKLYKLFVIRNRYYIMERPSLKNFQAGDQETVFFFSHDISKPNSSSSLTELDDIDKLNLQNMMLKLRLTINSARATCDNELSSGNDINACSLINSNDNINKTNLEIRSEPYNGHHQLAGLWPNDKKLSKIVEVFSEKLGLTFYGLDIIIENETSRYAIIDMNTFPGYDGVENFLTIFRDVVIESIPNESQLQQLQNSNRSNKKKPNEIDSGIEST